MSAREAAIQAVKDHPSTTFMAPYESLADAVLDAAQPLIRAEVLAEAKDRLLADLERQGGTATGQYAVGMERAALLLSRMAEDTAGGAS